MGNYRLTLAYDGTRYHGWQRLAGARTVQSTVETALTQIFAQPVEISGSGRTDAGVHARGQVASFAAPERDCASVLRQLRALLPPDIGALSLSPASARFHARLSATRKTYHYRIWNSEVPDVFERRWRVAFPQRLDEEAMHRAAACLIGRHDFGAFSSAGRKKSTVRTLKELSIVRTGDEICFVLTADGFLYNMVRILVGTLLEVGAGERTAESVAALLDGAPRAQAGKTAPARGLCLMEVRYD